MASKCLNERGSCKTPRQWKIEDFEPHCVGQALPVRRVDGGLPERVGEEARMQVGFKRVILRVEEFCNWLERVDLRLIDFRANAAGHLGGH